MKTIHSGMIPVSKLMKAHSNGVKLICEKVSDASEFRTRGNRSSEKKRELGGATEGDRKIGTRVESRELQDRENPLFLVLSLSPRVVEKLSLETTTKWRPISYD